MINTETEPLFPLSKAASLLPAVRGNKPPHSATLYRWATAGLKSRSGRNVVLETTWVGGTRMVSQQALERFSNALDDVEYVSLSPARAKLKDALEKQAQSALEVLRQHGMLAS